MKKAESFQHKIMRIFLPVILSVILLSGLLLYFLSTRQVEDNARYLIANTTRQTANLIDAKLKLTLEQCTKLNQTLAIWRMVNNSYQANSTPQQNSDLIEVNRALEQIYNDSDGAVDSIAFHTAYNFQGLLRFRWKQSQQAFRRRLYGKMSMRTIFSKRHRSARYSA